MMLDELYRLAIHAMRPKNIPQAIYIGQEDWVSTEAELRKKRKAEGRPFFVADDGTMNFLIGGIPVRPFSVLGAE